MRALLSLAFHPKRLLGVIAGTLALATYVWFAAVRAVPGVRQRKAASRRAWAARVRNRP